MRKFAIVGIELCLFSCVVSFANAGDILRLLPPEICLPDVGPEGKNSTEIQMRNPFNDAVTIEEVRSSCGCTVVQARPERISAGAVDRLRIAYEGGAVVGKRRVSLLLKYSVRGEQKDEVVQLDLCVVELKIKFQQPQYDFGERSAALIEPIRLIVNNVDVVPAKLSQITPPASFTAQVSGLDDSETLAPGHSATILLRPQCCIPSGDYSSTVELSFQSINAVNIASTIQEVITGSVLSPRFDWLRGRPNEIVLSEAAPILKLAVAREQVLAFQTFGAFDLNDGISDGPSTLFTLKFRDHVQIGERLTGIVRIFLDDPNCPMLQIPLELVATADAPLVSEPTGQDRWRVRSENGDLAGKIIEVDDLRGRKLACHVGENGQSAALLSKPSVPNAVEVLILWKSGAIGEEIVPLTGRNRN